MMRARTLLQVFASSLLAASAALPACNAVIGNSPGQLAPDDGGTFDAGTIPPSYDSGPIVFFDAGDATVTAPIPDAAAPDSAPPPFDAGTIPTCSTGEKLCSGACVEDTDPLYGCSATSCTTCALAHAVSVCSASGCAVSSCEPGYADCDGNAANGCEADLSQASHCGSCNAVCGASAPDCAPSGATFACSTGCGANLTLCGSQCVSLTSSLDDCGACGTVCPVVSNGKATCDGTCGFTCNADFHTCGAACASDVSVSTCGSSCSPCPTGANAVATCNGVQCGLACTANHANCNGVATDGCEVDLMTDATNCGACGTSCNGQPCVSGVCQAPPVVDSGPPPVVDSGAPPVVDSGSGEDSSVAPPDDAAAD